MNNVEVKDSGLTVGDIRGRLKVRPELYLIETK